MIGLKKKRDLFLGNSCRKQDPNILIGKSFIFGLAL